MLNNYQTVSWLTNLKSNSLCADGRACDSETRAARCCPLLATRVMSPSSQEGVGEGSLLLIPHTTDRSTGKTVWDLVDIFFEALLPQRKRWAHKVKLFSAELFINRIYGPLKYCYTRAQAAQYVWLLHSQSLADALVTPSASVRPRCCSFRLNWGGKDNIPVSFYTNKPYFNKKINALTEFFFFAHILCVFLLANLVLSNLFLQVISKKTDGDEWFVWLLLAVTWQKGRICSQV